MNIRFAAVAVAALVFALAVAPARAAANAAPAEPAAPATSADAARDANGAGASLPQMLAAGRGPIDWQYDDETRIAMDNDMELFRLYNLAMDAKARRKAIAMGTFIPGAILTAVGFFGALFQDALGLYSAKVGELVLVGGVGCGLPLVGVGIGFLAIDSQAEKDYLKYVHDKYHVVPILQLAPTKGGMVANLGVHF